MGNEKLCAMNEGYILMGYKLLRALPSLTTAKTGQSFYICGCLKIVMWISHIYFHTSIQTGSHWHSAGVTWMAAREHVMCCGQQMAEWSTLLVFPVQLRQTKSEVMFCRLKLIFIVTCGVHWLTEESPNKEQNPFRSKLWRKKIWKKCRQTCLLID